MTDSAITNLNAGADKAAGSATSGSVKPTGAAGKPAADAAVAGDAPTKLVNKIFGAVKKVTGGA